MSVVPANLSGSTTWIEIKTESHEFRYKVLEYLMMHAGVLVSKADLTEHVYQQAFDRDSDVLEVFIGRLRKKLDPDGALKPIETVRGRGYRFALAREADESTKSH
jgi:two-component system response regulator PhoP